MAKLRTDPETFQPRSMGLDHGHVAELERVLKDGKELDQMRVRSNNDGTFTVIDGHHSLAAYQAVGWPRNVPVLVYSCTEAQAQQIAVAENSKARLQMSPDDKSDWAWRLTVDQPGLSRRRVAELCGVSQRTVSNMRKVRDVLRERNGEDLPETWREALLVKKGGAENWEASDQEEWDKREKAKLKQRIGADIARLSKNKPGLVLEVVQETMGESRFADGCDWLGYAKRDEADIDDMPF